MYEQPEAWDLLMDKMCRTLIPFLKAQVRAGAQVVQLFDSWVGCLDPSDYERYVLEHTRKIFRELRAEGIPSIHFGTGTAGLLPLMAQAGGDVIGVDWRLTLGEAWRLAGPASRGTSTGCATGPGEVLARKAAEVLDSAAGRPGHIFNLGHGIMPPTPEDAVRAVVDLVHERSAAANRTQPSAGK